MQKSSGNKHEPLTWTTSGKYILTKICYTITTNLYEMH